MKLRGAPDKLSLAYPVAQDQHFQELVSQKVSEKIERQQRLYLPA